MQDAPLLLQSIDTPQKFLGSRERGNVYVGRSRLLEDFLNHIKELDSVIEIRLQRVFGYRTDDVIY
jgi:hypothetical protein